VGFHLAKVVAELGEGVGAPPIGREWQWPCTKRRHETQGCNAIMSER
jgi:hypothetical protein